MEKDHSKVVLRPNENDDKADAPRNLAPSDKRSAPKEEKPSTLSVRGICKNCIKIVILTLIITGPNDVHNDPATSKEKPQFSTVHYVVGAAILLFILYFMFF